MGIFSTIWTAIQILTLATGIKGWRQARKLQKRGQDILATRHPDGGRIPVIFGQRRVGATMVYMDTNEGRSKDLYVVYALSVGEVDDILLDTIEINGVPITDSQVFRQGYYLGSDRVSSGAGSLCTASQNGDVQVSNAGRSGSDPTKRYRMVFNAHHGATDQTADPMLTASLSKWTSAHRLRGIAYIAASFEYDSKGMFSSTPELTCVVRGKRLYDPTEDDTVSGGSGDQRIDDSSTWTWSDNAALAVLDYLKDTEYGKGLTSSQLDLPSFIDAAALSDELVDIPEFAGSFVAGTFSGTSGDSYFDVDEDTWARIKAGIRLSLKDSGDSDVFVNVQVNEVQRSNQLTESTRYRVYVNNPLTSTYTNETSTFRGKCRRFHCNGVIDTNDNVLENTRDLLANCRGILNYIDGKYSLEIEDTGSSIFSVNEDHIIDSAPTRIQYEDKSRKYNKVVVSYYNGQKKFEPDTVTVLHDATPNFTSDDNGEILEAKVEFDFVTNPYIAYNLGKAILGRSRNSKTVSFTGTPRLLDLVAGDIIDITYAGLGLSGTVYRV